MKVKHELEVELYGEVGVLPGANEFANCYSGYHIGPTKTRFVFPDDKVLEDATSFLRQYKLKANHIYNFEFELDEIKDYPAFYLNFANLYDLLFENRVNLKALKKQEVAKDYQTERLVVNSRVKSILESLTQKVQWSELEASGKQKWFAMEIVQHLPDPIFIPAPFATEPNEHPSGTYSLQFDGRSIITEPNVQAVKKYGICLPDRMKVNSKILRRYPVPLVASGAVVYALRSARVNDIYLNELFPLLLESDPLNK